MKITLLAALVVIAAWLLFTEAPSTAYCMAQGNSLPYCLLTTEYSQ